MTDPMQSGMSKRTSRPSAKLLDADNGEEPELRSHKAARDRAIAAEEVSKLSHDLTAVPAPQKNWTRPSNRYTHCLVKSISSVLRSAYILRSQYL